MPPRGRALGAALTALVTLLVVYAVWDALAVFRFMDTGLPISVAGGYFTFTGYRDGWRTRDKIARGLLQP